MGDNNNNDDKCRRAVYEKFKKFSLFPQEFQNLSPYEAVLQQRTLLPKIMSPPWPVSPVPGTVNIPVDEPVNVTENVFRIRGRWVNAPGQEKSPSIIFHIHGGGFSLGDSSISVTLMSHISHFFKMRVFSVDYRLAPEFPFPNGLHDCLFAYKWLLKSFKPENILFMGESAGGNLVVATALAAKLEDLPLPFGVVSLSGLFNRFGSYSSFTSNIGSDVMITKLNATDEYYLGPLSRSMGTSPLAYPIRATDDQLAGFPPTYLWTSRKERLLDDTVMLERRMIQAGVDVTAYYDENPYSVHCMLMFLLPETSEGIVYWGKIRDWVWTQNKRKNMNATSKL